MNKITILGICAFFHDASACLIQDGKLVAFVEEERFLRKKRIGIYPYNSVEYCLKEANLILEDIDVVGFYVHPGSYLLDNAKVSITYFPDSLRLLKPGAAYLPLRERMASMFALKGLMRKQHNCPKANFKVHYIHHHLAHGASSFLVSPFSESAIVTIDAAGEGISTAILYGKDNKIFNLGKDSNVSKYPHSLTCFYAASTEYLGFRVGLDEYKVLGLSAYGQPKYKDKIYKMVKWTKNNKVELDLSYFQFHTQGVHRFFGEKMEQELGSSRKRGDPITEKHQDIACSVQKVFEELALKVVRRAHILTRSKNLCSSGGGALNCLMNTRIIRETPFENLFVQPVANDAGGSIGAAYYIYNCIMKKPRKFIFEHVYYGPSFTDGDYKSALESYGLEFEYEPKIAKRVARHLKEGAIVGWFQGRMEAGPRALGNRSMLADPRRKDMKDIINLKIKNREYFRPFAPSVLEDKADEYFDRPGPCPFMIMIADVYPEKKERIPAVTHVDGTARIQTVSKKTNPQFYELIEEFHKLTGVPVLLNTSFNENEPIVCTPNNAIECFLRTGLDILVLGNFIAYKK